MDAHSALRRTVLLALVLMLLAPVGTAAAAGRVIGGHKVEPDDFESHWKSIVSLQWKDVQGAESHFCGGVLIAPQAVLTARHCVEQDGFVLEPGLIRVRGGAWSLDANGGAASVSAIERTPDAPGTWFETGGDLAVLHLDRALTRGVPIALAGPEQASWWGAGAGRAEGVRLAGWGIARDADILHERDFGAPPSELQTADMPILADDACAASDPKDTSLRLHLCAGVRDDPATPAVEARSACYGDSGGPLIASDPAGVEPDRLIGIVSRGTQFECSKGTSIFVKVADRAAWIQSELAPSPQLRDAGPMFRAAPQKPSFRTMVVSVLSGDAGTAQYVVEFHPKRWRAWYEIGRMTGGGPQTFGLPPTFDGMGALRIVRIGADGHEQVMRTQLSTVLTARDRAAPLPIKRFTARRVGVEHVLNWAPALDRGDRIVGIEIQQRRVGSAKWLPEGFYDCAPCRADARQKLGHTSREVFLPGKREFRISSMDRAGNWSVWSYATER